MSNNRKEKIQLMNELKRLRQRIVELEKSETKRKPTEEALRESEGKYRALVERANDGIVIAQGNFIRFANSRFAEMLGYEVEELTSTEFTNFLSPGKLDEIMDRYKRRLAGEDIPSIYETALLKKNGEEIPVEVNAGVILYKGKPANMSFIRDITDRKQAEEQLKASLKEKEVLLKEIHHRVKNNLQIISSLLKLQSRYIEDKRNVEMLKESQNRIKSMALIHEKLYQSRDLSEIDFKEYIKTLTNRLFRSYAASPQKIALTIEAEDILLGVDSAIPCGLIVNELVSNSLKHAFPNNKEGEIKIGFHSINEKDIELVISDNGVGLPEEIDFRNTKSLGLHLVTILAEDQLNGEINLDRKKGTKFRIKLFGVK